MTSHWRTVLAAHRDRRVLTVLLLGFSSGLPLLLVYSTLSAWLSEAGVPKALIGLVSWAGIAYALKFLWSPVVDRLALPWLTARLGRRRAWLLASQVATAVAIVGLGATDPATGLWPTASWAAVLAFASATQDVVVDAYRVEILDEQQQGAGAAVVVIGYRVGMLAAGAGALVIADHVNWLAAHAVMALLLGVGVVATLLAAEPAAIVTDTSAALERRGAEWLKGRPGIPLGWRPVLSWLHAAVLCPFLDFARRRDWGLILAFVALYKYGDALLSVMANPFYLELGFTKTEVGLIANGYGLGMTLAGGLAGGVLVARWGVLRALLIGGLLQAASNLAFVGLALAGASRTALVATISAESFTGGLGTAAFVAYLSLLCHAAYTATQYALLSSFAALGRTLLASGGGWLADHVGWTTFFLLTLVAAVPGLALLALLLRHEAPGGGG